MKAMGREMWWDRERCCDTAHPGWAASPAQGRGLQDRGMFLPLRPLPKQRITVDGKFSPEVAGTESGV